MSKSQNGNKEAKKPKKQAPAPTPGLPAGTNAGALAVASLRGKKGTGGYPVK